MKTNKSLSNTVAATALALLVPTVALAKETVAECPASAPLEQLTSDFKGTTLRCFSRQGDDVQAGPKQFLGYGTTIADPTKDVVVKKAEYHRGPLRHISAEASGAINVPNP